MNAADLKEVIRLHGMWRRGESGGARAYLADADLANVRDVLGTLVMLELEAMQLERVKTEVRKLCGLRMIPDADDPAHAGRMTRWRAG